MKVRLVLYFTVTGYFQPTVDYNSELELTEELELSNLDENSQVQYMITMDRYVDVDRENNLCVNVNGGVGNYSVQLDIFTGNILLIQIFFVGTPKNEKKDIKSVRPTKS